MKTKNFENGKIVAKEDDLLRVIPDLDLIRKEIIKRENFKRYPRFGSAIVLFAAHREDWLDTTHDGFNTQQNNILAGCAANTVLWALDVVEFGNIQTEQGIWNGVAPAGLDIVNRNQPQHNAMIAVYDVYKPQFREYVMMQLYPNTKITVAQRTQYDIPQLHDNHKTHPTVKIATPMFLKAWGGGSGHILWEGHENGTEKGRAHIPHGLDIHINEQELAYVMLDNLTVIPDADSIGNPKVQNSPGTRVDFSKAHGDLDVGTGNSGKWIVIYSRWIFKAYPQFAGDWSESPVIMRIP